MSKNIFVFDNKYIEDLKNESPVFTDEATSILYAKLEKDKKGFLIEDTSVKEESPVKFIFTVSTDSSNKVVVDDLTNLPFFVTTPQKYIAMTLWENCCIVAKEFIDTYKNPSVPDYSFYPYTNLIKMGAYIHNETNEVYVFCHLFIKEGLEEALNCTFVNAKEYQRPLDYKLFGLVTDLFKRVKVSV